jgi:RNA polymerase sigma-70 factor (ECF subfamily)
MWKPPKACTLEPRDDLTPDKLFDRRWALVLLERVLTHLRDDQVSAGKGELFDSLKGFLTGDSAGAGCAGVATRLGMTEGAVKVAVHRLRRQFRDTLIQEIADTVADPADIDAEIRYLLKAVSE